MRRLSALAFAGVAFITFGSVACVSVPEQKFVADGGCDFAASAPASSGENGPFRVGYRTFEHTYSPQGESAARTIPLHIWFPTNDTTGDTKIRYQGLFADEFGTQSGVSPALPQSPCGYPVMAFSHGHIGFAGGIAYMATRFASHGWLIVAPEHVGNTLTDNIDPRPPTTYLTRPQDLSAALDALDQLPAGDPLQRLAATDRVLAVGHSFGAHTLWSVLGMPFPATKVEAGCAALAPECSAAQAEAFKSGFGDARFAAAIIMDGLIDDKWMDLADAAAVTVPAVLMTGVDRSQNGATEFTAARTADFVWLDVAGACHESFNSAIWTGCEDLDPETGYEVINHFALAFARHYVLGDVSGDIIDIVNGEVELSPLVTYSRK